MCDVDRRHGLTRHQIDQIVDQQFARLAIQRRQGLIHQHDGGIDAHRARNGDALLHAAGQLPGIGALEVQQVGAAQNVVDAAVDFLAPEAMIFEHAGDVAAHRTPRQQREILEHVGQRIERTGWRRATLQHLALGGFLQPAEKPQQCRLAAARWPDDADDLAAQHVEINTREHLDAAVVVRDAAQEQVHHLTSTKLGSTKVSSVMVLATMSCSWNQASWSLTLAMLSDAPLFKRMAPLLIEVTTLATG